MRQGFVSLLVAILFAIAAIFVLFDERVSFSKLSSWSSAEDVNLPN